MHSFTNITLSYSGSISPLLVGPGTPPPIILPRPFIGMEKEEDEINKKEKTKQKKLPGKLKKNYRIKRKL